MRLPTLLALLAALGAAFGQPYDHVVVTASSHASAYAPLSAWVEGRLGMTDTVVAVEDILPAYPGRDAAEKVRNFIGHAYTNWGTTHVLLGGDVDVVPHRLAYVYRSGRTQNIPCDLYYADLDGNWDADEDNVFGELEDSVDLYPDIVVGRLVASTPDVAARLVGKVLSYSSDSTAAYLASALLAGFDLYDNPVIRGEYHCEIVDTTHLPELVRPCRKVYDSHSGDHKADILDALNDGMHVWVHADHGSWWSVGAGYLRHGATINYNELAALANGSRYTIGFVNGCHVGAFDSSDCVIEGFLSAPNGGGVAAFANARPGLTTEPDWHRAGSYLQAQLLVDRLFNQGGSTRLDRFAGLQAIIAPLADTSATYRWCHYQYNLFGEPLMPVWVPELTGVEETAAGGHPRLEDEAGRLNPTVMRARELAGLDVRVLDAAGRDVTDRRERLAPGVYFVMAGRREAGAKVIVQR